MDIKTLEYKEVGEIMHQYDYESGLKAFVIPKKGYSKKYAVFATHFGSINTEFIEAGKKETTTVPEGVAHFLEHKLFDQKDGNIMDKFSLLGSKPNAYTSFNQTVYLFSCTDKFIENFRLLLNFVQNPYFIDESVEKEKSIIKQEINMYRDNANWRSMFNYLGALYKNNKVRNEILGTHESIDEINKEILLKCYNNFYNLKNMAICVVGDVNKDEVFSEIMDNTKSSSQKNKLADAADNYEVKRVFPEEPDDINNSYVEQKMQVSNPYFQMGYKDNFIKGNQAKDKLELLRREVSIKIVLDMLMGRSSNLYKSLYEQGLINNTFNFNYTSEENYAYSIISGESKNPHKVKDLILQHIDNNIDRLKEEDFIRVRNAMYGRNLRWFNSVETISGNFITSFFKGIYLFDYFTIYDKIDFKYITDIMKEHFNRKYFALSVIMPS